MLLFATLDSFRRTAAPVGGLWTRSLQKPSGPCKPATLQPRRAGLQSAGCPPLSSGPQCTEQEPQKGQGPRFFPAKTLARLALHGSRSTPVKGSKCVTPQRGRAATLLCAPVSSMKGNQHTACVSAGNRAPLPHSQAAAGPRPRPESFLASGRGCSS